MKEYGPSSVFPPADREGSVEQDWVSWLTEKGLKLPSITPSIKIYSKHNTGPLLLW